MPRFLTKLISGSGSVPFGKAVWEDTRLALPGAAPGAHYRNVFTGEVLAAAGQAGKAVLMLGEVFACFPAALLERIR